MTPLAVALALATATPPPVVQPPSERARQQLMPQSPDPLWRTLAHTRVTADVAHGIYLADHPPEVRALEGREVAVQGFMLPVTPFPPFAFFTLTRFTPVCAFCPPGAPNEAMEVQLSEFTKVRSGLITVQGRLHLHKDGATGLFFRLDDAHITE